MQTFVIDMSLTHAMSFSPNNCPPSSIGISIPTSEIHRIYSCLLMFTESQVHTWAGVDGGYSDSLILATKPVSLPLAFSMSGISFCDLQGRCLIGNGYIYISTHSSCKIFMECESMSSNMWALEIQNKRTWFLPLNILLLMIRVPLCANNRTEWGL